MATPGPALTPPPIPDGGQAPPPNAAPTSPPAASPAPPSPSPQVDQGSAMLIKLQRDAVAIAKMFPMAVPAIRKVNDAIQEAGLAIMQSAKPGEPQAPPTAG